MSTPRIAMCTPRIVVSTPRIITSSPRIVMSTPRIIISSPRIVMLHYYIYTDDSLLPTTTTAMSTPKPAVRRF